MSDEELVAKIKQAVYDINDLSQVAREREIRVYLSILRMGSNNWRLEATLTRTL